jgi:hypothetical protein
MRAPTTGNKIKIQTDTGAVVFGRVTEYRTDALDEGGNDIIEIRVAVHPQCLIEPNTYLGEDIPEPAACNCGNETGGTHLKWCELITGRKD